MCCIGPTLDLARAARLRFTCASLAATNRRAKAPQDALTTFANKRRRRRAPRGRGGAHAPRSRRRPTRFFARTLYRPHAARGHEPARDQAHDHGPIARVVESACGSGPRGASTRRATRRHAGVIDQYRRDATQPSGVHEVLGHAPGLGGAAEDRSSSACEEVRGPIDLARVCERSARTRDARIRSTAEPQARRVQANRVWPASARGVQVHPSSGAATRARSACRRRRSGRRIECDPEPHTPPRACTFDIQMGSCFLTARVFTHGSAQCHVTVTVRITVVGTSLPAPRGPPILVLAVNVHSHPPSATDPEQRASATVGLRLCT